MRCLRTNRFCCQKHIKWMWYSSWYALCFIRHWTFHLLCQNKGKFEAQWLTDHTTSLEIRFSANNPSDKKAKLSLFPAQSVGKNYPFTWDSRCKLTNNGFCTVGGVFFINKTARSFSPHSSIEHRPLQAKQLSTEYQNNIEFRDHSWNLFPKCCFLTCLPLLSRVSLQASWKVNKYKIFGVWLAFILQLLLKYSSVSIFFPRHESTHWYRTSLCLLQEAVGVYFHHAQIFLHYSKHFCCTKLTWSQSCSKEYFNNVAPFQQSFFLWLPE